MITTATVYTFLFIHIGVILVVTAYYVLGAAVAPTITDRARQHFARRPWLPLLVGLLVSVPWVFAAIALLAAPAAAAKFAGAVAGCLWILGALLGGAGLAQHIGRGSADGAPTWQQSVRGGLFISLTWVLPLVGWLGMLPLTLAAGLGCLIFGFVPVKPRAAAVPAATPETAAPTA